MTRENKLLISRLAAHVAGTDEACKVCIRKDKCVSECDSLSDGKWIPPDNDICAANIIAYFRELI